MGTTTARDGPSTVDRPCLQRSLRVLASDELVNAPVRKKLLRIVALAAEAFPDCYAAATVDAHDGEVCTNLAAYRLDQAQYRSGVGPGAVAKASRKPVRVDVIAGCAWVEFRRAAAENRIASSVSLPLSCDGTAVGVLNLYARAAAAFAGCEAEAAAFAAAASRLLAPR